jgi:amino acid transporter
MTSQDPARLQQGVLGTADIVFMVMAAAAPLGVVVTLLPIAFAFGNGGGLPGTYLCAVVAMLLFAVGYVRIMPFVRNAGAFYAYITASINREFGLAAAYVATLSYVALSCSTLTSLAFFSAQFVENVTGTKSHWMLWAAVSLVALTVLSYHRITLAAKVLGVALTAEVALILLLDAAIIQHASLHSLTLQSFSPRMVLTPGLGIAAIYGFNGMLGVESTAIYQEEARERGATIPQATYICVIVVGLFYVLTAWCLAAAVGPEHVSAIARSSLGTFVADQGVAHLGKWAGTAFGVLTLTSSFAAALALFNNAARYLFALARDGVLPGALARIHPRHGSPHVAALLLAAILAAVMAGSALAGLDPLVNVTTALVGVGSVGLMALLAITALAIPLFFLKRRIFGLRTSVAPVVGGTVIAIAVCLAFTNYAAITGVTSAVVNNLPYLLVMVALLGALQARWLRTRNPLIYSQIGATRVDESIGSAPGASPGPTVTGNSNSASRTAVPFESASRPIP